MGDRGRLVVPAAVRKHAGLAVGTSVTLIETDDGIVMLTREQLKRRVRAALADADLVGTLLRERRSAAADEDLA